ncbi:hypothetical protein AGRA3207_007404 [Actinomadura graeca]|uniref:MerR family transcriptional regulator n=1 Tax=Actinomadura graeca TaxID=2750812 RepID=A0ABX8R4T8_9ACTN|nr:hypothetical protein [Actinomadura graeca]QXJ25843.1 hypothetical protein AGRA3207_007404 [Actinomadura graeca]
MTATPGPAGTRTEPAPAHPGEPDGTPCAICGAPIPAQATRCVLAWGWVAVLHCTSGGFWHYPRQSALLAGVSTAHLRNWAQHGLITALHSPPATRRYYEPELHALAKIVRAQELAALPHTAGRRLLAEHLGLP